MRLFGQIILLCLLISAIQGVVAVLMIAIVLSLIWGLFYRTEQTVGLIGLGLLLSALQVHPWLTLGAVGVLTGCLLIGRSKETEGEMEKPPIPLPPPAPGSD